MFLFSLSLSLSLSLCANLLILILISLSGIQVTRLDLYQIAIQSSNPGYAQAKVQSLANKEKNYICFVFFSEFFSWNFLDSSFKGVSIFFFFTMSIQLLSQFHNDWPKRLHRTKLYRDFLLILLFFVFAIYEVYIPNQNV